MVEKTTELEKRNIVRLSNKEARQMTRSCLHAALVQILEKKDINNISVSELTRKAGVSRTAFYSNYQTIDDVLAELIDQKLTELNTSIWEAINKKEDFFRPIIQEMKDDYDQYVLLLKSNIENTVFFQMRDYIKKTYPTIDSRSYYLMIGMIGSLRNIVLEWIVNGSKESVDMIASICNETTKNIREEFLNDVLS